MAVVLFDGGALDKIVSLVVCRVVGDPVFAWRGASSRSTKQNLYRPCQDHSNAVDHYVSMGDNGPMGDDYRRDANGYFAAGNKGGPGRRKRETEREYIAATIETCPLDKWRTIVLKAVEQAMAGEHHSREWLSKYLLPEISRLHLLDDEEKRADGIVLNFVAVPSAPMPEFLAETDVPGNAKH